MMSERADLTPPHSIEAEEAIIGAVLLDPATLDRCPELAPSDFYRESHRQIYAAAVDLHRDGTAPDLVTLAELLRERGHIEGVGGAAYLAEIQERVPTAANAPKYAEIIRKHAISRSVASEASQLATAVMRGDISLADSVPERCAKMAEVAVGVRARPTMQQRIIEVAERFEKVASGERQAAIAQTGFAALDRVVGGWFADYTLLASRPSVGKTALALALALRLGRAQIPCRIVSAEMSTSELLTRGASQIAGVNASAVRYGRINFDDVARLATALDEISTMPIEVLEGVRDWYAIEGHIRRWAREGVRIVFIDHLRKVTMRSRQDTRERIMAEVSHRIFELTRDRDIGICALQQIGREAGKRPDKRPILEDLRDSGALEEDADNVWMPYYPHDHGSKQSAHDFEVIIRKNRNGPKDTVTLYHDRATQAFDDPISADLYGEEYAE